MHKHARNAALAIIALLVALPLATANAKWLDKTQPNLPFGVYLQGLQGSVVLSLTLNKSGQRHEHKRPAQQRPSRFG